MSKTENPKIYQFDEYQLDLTEEILRRNGEKVVINRRTFQVLKLLVERAGEIVGKQEFLETVWADTFVEDNVLTVTMTALRKALGDNPKQPKFIENLPRKGYRFISEVKVIEDAPPVVQVENDDALSLTETQKSRPIFKNRKIFLTISAGCLLFLLAVFGINYSVFTNVVVPWSKINQIESVAVLPFENQNLDTEFLSDGLTDSIINSLSELGNLRVISRNSVFQYKGKKTDSTAIGRELNVNAVLTGRFVERGDDLIVSAELTDVRDNKQIWGRQYNRKTIDAFALQHEIAGDVAEKLRSKLTDAERHNIARRGTDNAEAFRLYLKGRYEWNKRTAEGFAAALDYFNQAVDKDPTYALAYDGIAKCYLSGSFEFFQTSEKRAAFVKEAARKALEIDPNLGEAYATLAINSHFNEWNWKNADQEFKRALELKPNYATAHHWYAEFLATEGRFDESFAEYQRALELDPLSLAISTDLGFNYYYARQYDRAIEYLQKLKELNPNYARTYVSLSAVYIEKGMYQDSIKEFKRGFELHGVDSQLLEKKKTMLEDALRTAGARGYWAKLLNDAQSTKTGGHVLQARAYAELGENDKAFEILETAYVGRLPSLVWLKVSPEYDNLRSDPRFTDLINRVGIPQ